MWENDFVNICVMNFFVFNLFGEQDEIRHFVGKCQTEFRFGFQLFRFYRFFKDVFEDKRNVCLLIHKRMKIDHL